MLGKLESDKRGRIGLELDYTGRQALEDDPYRSFSRAYFSMNALAEIRFKDIGSNFQSWNPR